MSTDKNNDVPRSSDSDVAQLKGANPEKVRFFDVPLCITLGLLGAFSLLAVIVYVVIVASDAAGGSGWALIWIVVYLVLPTFIATIGILVHNSLRSIRARRNNK